MNHLNNLTGALSIFTTCLCVLGLYVLSSKVHLDRQKFRKYAQKIDNEEKNIKRGLFRNKQMLLLNWNLLCFFKRPLELLKVIPLWQFQPFWPVEISSPPIVVVFVWYSVNIWNKTPGMCFMGNDIVMFVIWDFT